MSFRRELGRFDTAMVVVGGIIGAGVFTIPGYPFVPALFVAVAGLILGSVMWTSPLRSGLGFVLLGLGVPAYAYWSSKTGRAAPGAGAGPRPGGDD